MAKKREYNLLLNNIQRFEPDELTMATMMTTSTAATVITIMSQEKFATQYTQERTPLTYWMCFALLTRSCNINK